LSIGQLVRSEENQAQPARRILGWTGAIGAAVFGGAGLAFPEGVTRGSYCLSFRDRRGWDVLSYNHRPGAKGRETSLREVRSAGDGSRFLLILALVEFI
jgi:hypothetical protein